LTKYNFRNPCGWYKCNETCRGDYNINTVKIKYIFFIVVWNKNYTQDAGYIHKNKCTLSCVDTVYLRPKHPWLSQLHPWLSHFTCSMKQTSSHKSKSLQFFQIVAANSKFSASEVRRESSHILRTNSSEGACKLQFSDAFCSVSMKLYVFCT
jgi:hypothetical protein